MKRTKTNKKRKSERSYRSFMYKLSNLKEYKLLKKTIDILLEPLGCKKCGKCCKVYKVRITQEDINREPILLENSLLLTDNLKEKHKFKNNEEKFIRVMNGVDEETNRCVFYDDIYGCKIYESRPWECRDYTPSIWKCFRAKVKKDYDVSDHIEKVMKDFDAEKNIFEEDALRDRILMTIDALIIPFISSYKIIDGVCFFEPHFDEPIPEFIRRIFELDDKFKLIKDLPMFVKQGDSIFKAHGRCYEEYQNKFLS